MKKAALRRKRFLVHESIGLTGKLKKGESITPRSAIRGQPGGKERN